MQSLYFLCLFVTIFKHNPEKDTLIMINSERNILNWAIIGFAAVYLINYIDPTILLLPGIFTEQTTVGNSPQRKQVIFSYAHIFRQI